MYMVEFVLNNSDEKKNSWQIVNKNVIHPAKSANLNGVSCCDSY